MKNPIDQLEAAGIAQSKIVNDKLETFFEGKITKWNDEISPLFDIIRNDFNLNNAPKIIDVQSQALAYRQNIYAEINMMLTKRTSATVDLKNIKQQKFLFYTDTFVIKTNLSEKAILIEAHTTEIIRKIELIESYIEFLRSSSKTLESMGYTIKNIIEMHNYLGNK